MFLLKICDLFQVKMLVFDVKITFVIKLLIWTTTFMRIYIYHSQRMIFKEVLNFRLTSFACELLGKWQLKNYLCIILLLIASVFFHRIICLHSSCFQHWRMLGWPTTLIRKCSICISFTALRMRMPWRPGDCTGTDTLMKCLADRKFFERLPVWESGSFICWMHNIRHFRNVKTPELKVHVCTIFYVLTLIHIAHYGCTSEYFF